MGKYTEELERRVEELEKINAHLEAHNHVLADHESALAGDIIEINFSSKSIEQKSDLVIHFIESMKALTKETLKVTFAIVTYRTLKKFKFIDTVSICKKRIYKTGAVTIWQINFAKSKRNIWRCTFVGTGEKIWTTPIKSKLIGKKIDWNNNKIINKFKKDSQGIHKDIGKWKII